MRWDDNDKAEYEGEDIDNKEEGREKNGGGEEGRRKKKKKKKDNNNKRKENKSLSPEYILFMNRDIRIIEFKTMNSGTQQQT